MMNWKRTWAVFLRQYYLIQGNPTRVASMFLWTFINVMVWGFISKYFGTFGSATFSVVTVLLGAVILWDFLSHIQQGIMMAFLEDIWTQNFINFFASPLKIPEYLGGLVLTSLASSIVGFVVTIIFAGIAFGYNIFVTGLLMLPFLLILIIFGIAVGIFVSSLVFRLGPSAEWIAWPIPFVLSIFSAVYYPLSTLPIFLQWIAKIVPASYVFEGMRAVIAGGAYSSSLLFNLVVGTILSLLYLFVTGYYFIRVYQHNLNTGGIARFGAEQ